MSEKRLAPRLLCFFHRHDQKDFRKKLMYNSNEVYKRSRVFRERLVLGVLHFSARIYAWILGEDTAWGR